MATRSTIKLALDAMKKRNWRSEVEYMKHYKRAYYTTITKPKIEQKRKKLRY